MVAKNVSTPLNAAAGVTENRWIAAHRDDLKRYAGRWIAVLGEKVVVDKPSITEVYAFLRSEALADALILKVPARMEQPRHRIADARH